MKLLEGDSSDLNFHSWVKHIPWREDEPPRGVCRSGQSCLSYSWIQHLQGLSNKQA